jgi:PilZ domain-containing protein
MVALVLARVEVEFDGLQNWNFPGTFVLLALLAAVAIIALANAASQKNLLQKVRVPQLSALPTDAEAVANGMAAASRAAKPTFHDPRTRKSGRDKRKWLRRDGSSVPILVTDVATAGPPLEGLVLDRSRGGLLIVLPQAARVGSLLNIRAAHAPDDLARIPIQVRHCRPKGDGWLVGCKFLSELPWGVLLLFG